MTSNPKITPFDDGPLILTDAPGLRDADGADIPVGEKAALCRCGLSAKKPFCDGSHKAAGFSSAPDHSRIRNTPIAYSAEVGGTPVTVHYTPVLCSHAAECVAASNAVFDPNRKPWIKPENGTMAEVVAAMTNCPSGALRVEIGPISPQHLVDGEVSVVVERNGPYRVRNVELGAEFNGAGASRAKYVLCRCGHSANKPFCDGSHRDAGWTDS